MKSSMVFAVALALLPLAACGGSPLRQGGELEVVAVSITDGDTFTARGGGATFKVRLYGIDAPERGQDFSKRSRERLGEMCRSSPLRVRLVNRDGFGRWVAQVYDAAGRHLNAEMVASGLAWHFRKYSQDPVLERLEREARAAGRGLWSVPDPQAPWEYRAEHRSNR
jgi:endonuclease YncB( thermonuclease family)